MRGQDRAAGWIEVGTVARAHGVRGQLALRLHHPESEHVFAARRLRLACGDAVIERDVARLTRVPRGGLAHVDGVTDRDSALALVGATVSVPRATFPADAGLGAYFAFDLEGLSAVDAGGVMVGRVESVADFGAGALLVVRVGTEPVFVPFADPYVGAVDLVAQTVVVDLADLL